MRRLTLLALTSVALACAPPSTAEPDDAHSERVTPDAAPETTEPMRHFVGMLELPNGQAIDWLIRIEPGERDRARLWIPEQNIDHLAASETSRADDGELRMSWAALKVEWTISADGDSCELRQAGMVMDCELEEIDGEEFAEYIEVDRPQTPTPPFPYASEELRVPNPAAEGVTLAGTLTLPEGEGPHPAVVLVSGSGAQDRDETIYGHRAFWVIADALTRRGIAVMRYDDRGWAESTGEAEATTADYATDTLAVVRAVAARPDIDAARVGVVGHSEGGLIATMLAADHPQELGFIVLLAGPGVIGHELLALQSELALRREGGEEAELAADAELLAEVYEMIATRPEAELAEAIKTRWREVKGEDKDSEDKLASMLMLASNVWMRFFLAYDPRPDLERITCPVLALIGTSDVQVDDEQNLPAIEAALKTAGNERATVLARPGLNHLFQTSESGDPEDYKTITETFEPATLTLLGDWLLETTSG